MVVKQNRDCILVLISIPRTGTNFLCSLLNYHPLITSYYEIFHPKKFYSGYQNNPEGIIEQINQKYSVNFLNSEDIKLINWIHNNPTKLIDTLVNFNSKQYVSFKLFPDHLNCSIIESAIIKNRNMKKILVKRNLLATYVSHEIAIKTNKWNNFDTSAIRISLSVEKFAKWVNWAEQWYQLFENNSSPEKSDYFIINYEDIHAHKTNTDKLIYLDRLLKNIGLKLGTEYQIPNIDYLKMMKKQDTRTSLEEKIINYREFIEKAKDKGLSEHLG